MMSQIVTDIDLYVSHEQSRTMEDKIIVDLLNNSLTHLNISKREKVVDIPNP